MPSQLPPFLTNVSLSSQDIQTFGALLDALPIGVWLIDREGRMVFINQWMCQSMGIESARFLQAVHYKSVLPPEIAMNSLISDRQARLQDVPHYSTELVKFVDGQYHTLEIIKRKLVNADGQYDGLFGVALDITSHQEQQIKIHQLAFHDALTELPNRRWMGDRLQRLLSARHNGGCYALVLLDIHQFKTLNDSRGHEMGDQLLRLFARRVSGLLPQCMPQAELARIGGDEFAVLARCDGAHYIEAQHTLLAQIETLMTQLHQPFVLSQRLMSREQSWQHQVAMSAGVCLFEPSQMDADSAFKQAEIAMYQAKKLGLNQVVFFDPAMQSRLDERAQMGYWLQDALREQQLVLHFQPKQNALGVIHGAEALLRWFHPQQGFISPAAFIPLAEQTGFIHPIGDWVLDQACLELARWQSHPTMRHLVMAVNISANQFHQQDFVARISARLRQHLIPPSCLKLELTENLLVEDCDLTIGKMRELQALGVTLSIDDFGTGFASLSYLKRLPISEIKVDRSFVQDLPDDQDDKQIVQAIIHMAKAMQLNVVAEGVEKVEQLDFLSKLGCEEYQGYYWHKPMSADAFSLLFRGEGALDKLDLAGLLNSSLPALNEGKGS